MGEEKKLCPSDVAAEKLCEMAEYVIIEADGSKGLPFKAHLDYEPVIPQCAKDTILVIGMSGMGKRVKEAAHRTEKYCQLGQCKAEDSITPETAARVANAEGLHTKAFLNQMDAAKAGQAEELARLLNTKVYGGALMKGEWAMLVLIKGAGDLASGVALRLHRSGFAVAMTDTPNPTAIRRTVCFSEAIRLGETSVEGVKARRAGNAGEALSIIKAGGIPVIADEKCECRAELKPDAIVDAIIAKKNINTRIDDAPIVIALGPGFTAGADCHAVIETQRGHNLGRVILNGSAAPNTGVAGIIGGVGADRVLRAPCGGTFKPVREIGDIVSAGDIIATVNGEAMKTNIGGVLRGLLPKGITVHQGMKSGDVDPRGELCSCYTASDKAMAIAGGVLEAILGLSGVIAR